MLSAERTLWPNLTQSNPIQIGWHGYRTTKDYSSFICDLYSEENIDLNCLKDKKAISIIEDKQLFWAIFCRSIVSNKNIELGKVNFSSNSFNGVSVKSPTSDEYLLGQWRDDTENIRKIYKTAIDSHVGFTFLFHENCNQLICEINDSKKAIMLLDENTKNALLPVLQILSQQLDFHLTLETVNGTRKLAVKQQ